MKENNLISTFESWAKEKFISIKKLPESGSYREYYRITSKNKNAILVFNDDKRENIAFIKYTEHFLKKKLKVPKIYKKSLDKNIYLLEDLGDETLFSFIKKNLKNENIENLYKKLIPQIIEFQIKADENLDYSYSYPRPNFDKQSILWDLNYFKYNFLKLSKISFYEQDLEDDFEKLINILLQEKQDFFLYRDLQSRNIMIKNNCFYFIDYQGGRKGALQYDLASLLYDAKANISEKIRENLLDFYIETLKKHIIFDEKIFKNNFYAYALIRILQAFGAYGFRGIFERKKHFIESISFGIKNLGIILSKISFKKEIPNLVKILKKIIDNEKNNFSNEKKLKITINSFSYRRGIPADASTNGGGFVFDMRFLENPYWQKNLRDFNGKDKEIKKFFEKKEDIKFFLKRIFEIIDNVIGSYQKKNYGNLMINFGCTGGKHRSVYSAESLYKYLKLQKKDFEIKLKHLEL